jgi:hypothetical protein
MGVDIIFYTSSRYTRHFWIPVACIWPICFLSPVTYTIEVYYFSWPLAGLMSTKCKTGTSLRTTEQETGIPDGLAVGQEQQALPWVEAIWWRFLGGGEHHCKSRSFTVDEWSMNAFRARFLRRWWCSRRPYLEIDYALVLRYLHVDRVCRTIHPYAIFDHQFRTDQAPLQC